MCQKMLQNQLKNRKTNIYRSIITPKTWFFLKNCFQKLFLRFVTYILLIQNITPGKQQT